MLNIDKKIRRKFRIRPNDNLPYSSRRADRNTLATFFAEMNFNHGAEIGVRRGEYSKVLCDANPNLKLLCVDPWLAYIEAGQTRQNGYRKIAIKTLSRYNTTILHMGSMHAAFKTDNESLDFVYIDAAHDFDNIITDIICWSKKVKSGGIVSGHDYIHHLVNGGIVLAVNAYTRAHDIKNWYITADRYPSWFWVKQ